MTWLPWLIFVLSFVLHVFVVASLWRGAYKTYPFVFVYCLLYLVTITGEAAIFAGAVPLSKMSKAVYYYRVNALRDFLLFSVVVSLIEHAMRDKPYRLRVRYFLGVLAAIAVPLSLVIHSQTETFTLWMTQVVRDLSFGSGILTFLLWSLLIVSPKKDPQLLMVTGGLGVQFTGEAIGQSLRQLSNSYNGLFPTHRHGILFVGNLITSASHLIQIYVWWEAFRRTRTMQQIDNEPGGDNPEFRRQAPANVGRTYCVRAGASAAEARDPLEAIV
jgi:hypothetical protein